MQGRRGFKPRLFYTLSLEKLVPEDHELRKFAAVLRLDWPRGATAGLYSHTGQPSVDPVVLIGMMLLTVLYNVRSERQLATDTAVNLAYRWFLGYDLDKETPNHSVLSKARRRFGEELFVEFFSRVVEQCPEVGLVDGRGPYVDSTLMRAAAEPDRTRQLILLLASPRTSFVSSGSYLAQPQCQCRPSTLRQQALSCT